MIDGHDAIRDLHIDRDALRYFGIVRFPQVPGYFPQLGKTERQSKNLRDHAEAVVEVGEMTR